MTREQTFALAVRQMRRAQQKYFRCKVQPTKTELLKISIAREKEVDIEANAILHNLPATLTEAQVLKIESTNE